MNPVEILNNENLKNTSNLICTTLYNNQNSLENKDKQHICTSIFPTIEFLQNEKILTNVACIVPNCDETFSHVSALNFHLEKVHRIKNQNKLNDLLLTRARSKSQKILENCQCKYFCPIADCKWAYSFSLPTFHSLKNHFIRIHGEKSLSCSKCSKKFSIKSEMQRHEESCGVIYRCSCGCPFASKNSLLKHSRLKNHSIVLNDQHSSHIKGGNKNNSEKKIIVKKNDQKSIFKKKTNLAIQPSSNKPIQIFNNNGQSNQYKSFPILLVPLNLEPSKGSELAIFQNNIYHEETEISRKLKDYNKKIEINYENLIENENNKEDVDFNEFNSISFCQRSLGCQTKYQDLNLATQEIACQTILDQNYRYNSNAINQISIQNEYHKTYNNQTMNTTNSISTSTSTDILANLENKTNFQSQETQTLQNSLTTDYDYMNMFIADISTQTQHSSFSINCMESNSSNQEKAQIQFSNNNYVNNTKSCSIQTTENREMQTSEAFLINSCTQTLLSSNLNEEQNCDAVNLISNLELANLDEEMFFNEENNNNNYFQPADNNNNNEQTSLNYSSIVGEISMSFGVASCQTDELYFTNQVNTNSIQTQTHNFNFVNNNSCIDTITQTEWDFIGVGGNKI